MRASEATLLETEGYPWRAFAKTADWTPSHPPAPPPPDLEIGGD